MSDMDETFDSLYSKLKNSRDPGGRKTAWRSLVDLHAEDRLSHSQLEQCRELLLSEDDLHVRTTGIIYLDKVLHAYGAHGHDHSLQHWLFTPFRQAHGGSFTDSGSAVVITFCDNQYSRDVQALVEVARHLPTDRYPQTNFKLVSIESPDYADTGIDRADAVCLIGRPSLFKDCAIVRNFPADLRFSIKPPPEPDRVSGLAGQENAPFWCVNQERPNAGPYSYKSTQTERKRHDHGLVQRFGIRVGGRDVTVVVLAGGTSLGTLAAARWISQFGWGEKRRNEFARIAGLEANDRSMRFEAVLSVSSDHYDPARPWKPENIEAQCVFLNKSRNVLRVPKKLSLATETGTLASADDVRYLLFDDDEVELGEMDRAAAVAVCTKYLLDGRAVMPIAELKQEERLWPNRTCPAQGKGVNFFRDHLQRRSFNGIVEVAEHEVRLLVGTCAVGVTKARARGNSATAGG